MSDVLNELYESYGETSKVNLYSIDLKFTDFDQVDAIEVPEEVKEFWEIKPQNRTRRKTGNFVLWFLYGRKMPGYVLLQMVDRRISV